MNDREILDKFLEVQTFMVLAVTLDSGEPWALPVKIQQHKDMTFEWDSKIDTVHSKAIEKNPSMALTMFSRDTDPLGLFGFYAQGRGVKLVEKEHGVARYQFTVEKAWINDHTFIKREVQL